MKICTALGLLLISFQICTAQRTNVVLATTNTLAIYLVADSIPPSSITEGIATPAGFKLEEQPILSDADFVAWNVTNHTFVITPTAAKRLVGSRLGSFVIFASDEPVYRGKFVSMFSSSSAAVPCILTDLVLVDCFMGFTNMTDDVWRIIRCHNGRELTDRLLAMTNATTNVTLRINRGMDHGYPSDEFGKGVDPRGDKRIAAAVEKLFRNRKQ